MKIRAGNRVVHVTGQVVLGMDVANTCEEKICGYKNVLDLTMNMRVGIKADPIIADGDQTVVLLKHGIYFPSFSFPSKFAKMSSNTDIQKQNRLEHFHSSLSFFALGLLCLYSIHFTMERSLTPMIARDLKK